MAYEGKKAEMRLRIGRAMIDLDAALRCSDGLKFDTAKMITHLENAQLALKDAKTIFKYDRLPGLTNKNYVPKDREGSDDKQLEGI